MPPGQPDHRSEKSPSSHHIARQQSTNNKPRTASEPRQQGKRHTVQCVHITLPAAATLQFGNSVSVRTPTGRTCSHVTQSRHTHSSKYSQLKLSMQANMFIVLYGLQPDRRCSPGRVATEYPCSPQHDKHPHYRPSAQHQTSRNSLYYHFRILLTNGQQRLQVLILPFRCLHSYNTNRVQTF